MSLRLLLRLIFILLFAGLTGCSPKSQEPAAEKIIAPEALKADYEQLIKHYRQLISLEPENRQLKVELAGVYYDFRDYLPIKALLEGLDKREAKIILAKALVKVKDYSGAIEIFERLKPIRDNECLYLYARALEEKNLFPQALKIYEKVKSPFEEKARQRIGVIKVRVEDKIPSEVADISAQAESFLKELEDEAVVYLLVDEKIEINSDNTSLSTIHVIKKVLKERGKDIAEVEIGYDSTYERVELEFARTITREGRVIIAGEESVRNIGLYRNFPLYSNSKAFVVSMPAVEVGSFIEYKIKIYSAKLVNQDDASFIYRLREKYPVFKAGFCLVVPEGRTAYFKFFNRDYADEVEFEPDLTEGEGRKTYTWSFNRIKPIIPESDMPETSYVNPAIAISTFSSWDEIYQWWKSLYRDKLKLSPEIEEFVKNLISGEPDDYAKARKLYEFTAKNIRYVAIEYGDSGHEPHRADEVFINRYGDCKDQAVLLAAMLKFAGLKGYPVLIPTRSVYPLGEDFPSVSFNHAICAVEIDGELIFMDPTAETTAFGYIPLADQDRQVLVFMNDTWRIVNIENKKENKISYTMDITINNQENAVITRSIETYGFYASSYRWYLKYTHPAIIKEEIQRKMTEIASLSEFIDYQVSNVDDFDQPPALTYEFAAEKFLNPAGDLRIAPILDQLRLDSSLIGREERKYPVDFGGVYEIEARIKINLPDNLKVKYLPRSARLESDWFTLVVSYRENSGCVDFNQSFKTKKRFVGREEYSEFKNRLKEALYLLREEIILEKKR